MLVVKIFSKAKRPLAFVVITLSLLAVCAYAFLVGIDRPAFTPGSADALFATFAKDWTREQKRRGDAGAENLKKKIIKHESKYGELAEYWELRALYDVEKPKLIPLDYRKDKTGAEGYAVNTDCLERALRIVPGRAGTLAFAGKIEYQNVSADASKTSPGDEFENPLPPEMDLIYVEALEKAAEADSQNGYFHLLLATQYVSLGEWDAGMDEFRLAGGCEKFLKSSIFPLDKAVELRNNALTEEDLKKALPGISSMERAEFLSVFWRVQWNLTNYIRIKDSYKESAMALALGADAGETLTALHGAACTMGAGVGAEPVDALVAAVLIGVCAAESQVHFERNSEMAMAWIALRTEVDSIKQAFSLSSIHAPPWNEFTQNLLMETGSGLSVGQSAEIKRLARLASIPLKQPETDYKEFAPPGESEYKREYAALALLYKLGGGFADDKLMADYVRPAFERLKGLDYSNPGEWYENWLVDKKFVREDEEE